MYTSSNVTVEGGLTLWMCIYRVSKVVDEVLRELENGRDEMATVRGEYRRKNLYGSLVVEDFRFLVGF